MTMSDVLQGPLMLDTWLAKHATELDTTEPHSSLVLWRDAWGDKSGGCTFEQCAVARDPPGVRVECTMPGTYWVMKNSSVTKQFSSLYDYVDLTKHMITNVATPTRDLPVSSSDEDDTVHTKTSMTSPFVSWVPPIRVLLQIMVVTGNPGLGKGKLRSSMF
ncbi:hypothetical protein BV22DRAFT_1050967 [Leucogyrophana mollusca]|uniref:Uncharacterized protein n=1 Tax=Leucogyrophana mollusca TaxID=85980 RepID=A0ACB8B321_9AGAM|nr:hypothetical protein BV22DRAFT_1050967 [Leucogyrophana mollusca]